MRWLLGGLLLAVPAAALDLVAGQAPLPAAGVPLLHANLPDADLTPPTPTLEPPERYRWVFAPDARVELRLVVPDGVDRAVLTAWDWENRPVAQRALAAGPATVPVAVTGRGVWLLTLDCYRGDALASRLARSFAALPSVAGRRDQWASDEFFVGTCAFPGRQHWTNGYGPARPPGLTDQQARDLDAELAAASGCTVVRPDVPLTWREPGADPDWTTTDACVETWTSRGFRLGLQLSRAPEWALLADYAGVTDPKWRYPREEGPSRRVVRELVRRYADRAAFVELYNEPDNQDFWRGTPAQFIDLLGWTFDELRGVTPQPVVGSPSYCLIEPEWTGQFVRAVAGQVDLVTYHSHGDLDNLEWSIRAMRAAHAAAGYQAPVFANTEMGYAAWRLDVERLQAVTAIQKLARCWATGHRGALLYCSRGIGGPRRPAGDADWGFVDYTFCPRFAYGALTAWVDLLTGARFEQILAERGDLHAYLFRRGADRLVCWFAPNAQQREIRLESDGRALVAHDPMGNVTASLPDGRGEVVCGAFPRVVVLSGATSVRLP